MRQIGGAISVAAQAVLSSRLTYVEATLTGTPTGGGEIDNTAYIEFTPSAPFVFGGADNALQAPGIQLALQIWRKDDKTLLWRRDVVSQVGGKHSVRTLWDLILAVGTTYLIGWAKAAAAATCALAARMWPMPG